METALRRFLRQFKFKKHLERYIGIEREHFLKDALTGAYAPQAQEFLQTISDPRWTYELSICQVESRTRPQKDLSQIELELLENENTAKHAGELHNVYVTNEEVAGSGLPNDIYPDPRYLAIAAKMSPEFVRAGCRVAGTHVHVGCHSMIQAIHVRNALIPHLEMLCTIGDHSNGERLRLYRMMAKNWNPEPYKNISHFFKVAQAQEFAENPRNCWHLIRISRHGTVELRMFGTAESAEEILGWILLVRKILQNV